MAKTNLRRALNLNPQPIKWSSIPDDFQLVIDTREQLALFNPPPINIDIIKRTVHDGDYTINGLEHLFAIERKMISDLYSYVGSERTSRTAPKMERFSDMISQGGFVGLIIEASEADIMAGNPFSGKVGPNVVYHSLCSFEIRTGIHIYYNRDREMLERWIVSRAVKFWEHYYDNKGE